MLEVSGWFAVAGIIAVLVVLFGAMGIVRTMRGKRPVPKRDHHE
jgi:hypothetical protein